MNVVEAVADPQETIQNIGSAISSAYDTYMNGTPAEAGRVQGATTAMVAEVVVGSKGLGGINKLSKVAKADDASVPKQIEPIGEPGVVVISQIPEGWTARTSNSGIGTLFVDPSNPKANNVLVMNADPNSPNPSQQVPYVRRTLNGQTVDINGKSTIHRSSDAHIPRDQFRFNRN
jgi:hypothetical protein